ncbi:hypothetical protein LCGC14_3026430 [marine sediment metagenome]|uniref:Uncharacterized protein n=1 Tax=marine sediment metagenome TaxID=412755 RepID=A0A0F8XGU2_9ZZZZ
MVITEMVDIDKARSNRERIDREREVEAKGNGKKPLVVLTEHPVEVHSEDTPKLGRPRTGETRKCAGCGAEIYVKRFRILAEAPDFGFLCCLFSKDMTFYPQCKLKIEFVI